MEVLLGGLDLGVGPSAPSRTPFDPCGVSAGPHTARAPRGRRHRRRLRASPRPAAPARRPSSSLAVSSALVSLGRCAARSADAMNSALEPRSKRNGPGEVRPACAMRNHVFAGHTVGGFLHCGQDPRVHPALFANPFTNFWRAPTLPERRTAAGPGGWSINRTARSCERRMLNPPVRGHKICRANVHIGSEIRGNRREAPTATPQVRRHFADSGAGPEDASNLPPRWRGACQSAGQCVSARSRSTSADVERRARPARRANLDAPGRARLMSGASSAHILPTSGPKRSVQCHRQ